MIVCILLSYLIIYYPWIRYAGYPVPPWPEGSPPAAVIAWFPGGNEANICRTTEVVCVFFYVCIFSMHCFVAIFGMFGSTCGWSSRFNLKARQGNMRKALQATPLSCHRPGQKKSMKSPRCASYIPPSLPSMHNMTCRKGVKLGGYKLQGMCIWFINCYVCNVRGLVCTYLILPPRLWRNQVLAIHPKANNVNAGWEWKVTDVIRPSHLGQPHIYSRHSVMRTYTLKELRFCECIHRTHLHMCSETSCC